MNDMPPLSPDLFDGFDGRDDALRRITRYSLYPVMRYRTDVLGHSRHVLWLTEEMLPAAIAAFGPSLDPQKVRILALVHDDAEIVTGDIQAGNKSRMTAAQLKEVDDNERAGLEDLARRWPATVGGYSYRELLVEALEKASLEAQLVMLADKLDGFGESLHEVFAGNHHFVSGITNEYGDIPAPVNFYDGWLRGVWERYPDLSPLPGRPEWTFTEPPPTDYREICATSEPHTVDSIRKPTGHAHYDGWRELMLRRGGTAEARALCEPRESI